MTKMIRCRRAAAATVGAVGFAWSAIAAAQTAAIPASALNRYEPSERGSEWFANESLDFRGAFRPAFGITGDYGHRPYVLLNPDGTENAVVIANTTYVHIGAAFVLFQRLRIGASLPIAVAQNGSDKTVGDRTFTAPTEGGIGDLRVSADLRLFGEYGGAFTIALGGRVWIPTGDEKQYVGDGKARIGPRLTFAGDIGAFVYAAGAGFVYRANDQPLNGHPAGTEANFSAAMGVRVADKKLVIGPEVFGTTVVTTSSAVLGRRTTPLALLIGAHYTAGSFRVGLGAGPGLSRAAGTPEFRGLLSLDYVPAIEKTTAVATPSDRDHDGVMDGDDACADVAGVRTDDPKTNGCPADRDADGIIDSEDACPAVAGVKTTDPKTNGCPPDKDGDGVSDGDDACPDMAGMKTDDPKTNGCPSDGDKDSIYDKDDACPTVSGVKTDDPKTNGCPSDRDKDSIPDSEDACPDVAGPKSSDPKANGCPLVQIVAGQVKISQQIMFKTNSSELLGVSQTVIDAVAKIINEHAEIKHIRVEGHTDNSGTAIYNKELSRKRAASVVAALVKAGVAKARLSSEGFGLEKPLGDNSTEDGRTLNRRVEFHIEETATKK
jgi:outer membrane protein OmpA-like peptidoglycan-associated protein